MGRPGTRFATARRSPNRHSALAFFTVFIHPNTGQDLEDHRDRAIWMGQQVPLVLDIFKKKD